jgi:hypothetical protein
MRRGGHSGGFVSFVEHHLTATASQKELEEQTWPAAFCLSAGASIQATRKRQRRGGAIHPPGSASQHCAGELGGKKRKGMVEKGYLRRKVKNNIQS